MSKYRLMNRVLAGGMVVFALLMASGVSAAGTEDVLGLSTGVYYDVYLGSGEEGVSVIRNVKIVDIREVSGMTFLVITTDTFKQTRTEGLVSLSHVRAILPSNRFVNIPLNKDMQISH